MPKPRLVIVNSNYPNENNRYGDVFVHSRLKHYQAYFDIKVVGWKKKIQDYEFTYEGITVEMVNTASKLVQRIHRFEPNAIGFHFVEGWMYKGIITKFMGPVFIWVHGAEALGWYRRLFQLNWSTIYPFARYVARNTIQMVQMHNLIRYAAQRKNIRFIFVSRWMNSITEADTLSRVKDPIFIPNPIDSDLFHYHPKHPDQRKRILLIRSFDSHKYANDVAVAAIMELSSKAFFKELRFTIYGKGKYFEKITAPLKSFPNVQLNNFFIENRDIPAIHKDHGIFLCPTRQDAQGVSMCEAMSSGLVAISSFNTAIPEFIVQGESGFMSKSANEIAGYIEILFHQPETFLKMSKMAAEHIRRISSAEFVVKKEIGLLQSAIQDRQSAGAT